MGSRDMLTECLGDQTSGTLFFFSSPTVALLAQGIAAEFSQPVKFSQLDEKIKQLLSSAKTTDNDNPIAVGVIPFSEQQPVHFIVPERLVTSAPIRPNTIIDKDKAQQKDKNANTDDSGYCALTSQHSIPSNENYLRSVEAAERFCRDKNDVLEKVVLSRTVLVETQQDIDRAHLLKELLKQNPSGYTFSTSLGQLSPENHLMGSSPELLVSLKGSHVCSNPLAGSRRRCDNESINQQQAELMMESSKDLHEHAVVVDMVEKTLQPWCDQLYVPMVPSVVETRAMLHLSTRIEGVASSPEVSALQLACALHPTPAVCGYPTNKAYEFIREAEPFERGYFTGLVGWVDARGNGEWVVVIRCAEVGKQSLKAYAGAGIVTSSDPQSELEETTNKMRTIFNAAGIDLETACEVVT